MQRRLRELQSRPRRATVMAMRLIACLLCVGLFAVHSATPAGASHVSNPTRTRVEIYAPFTPDDKLASGIQVIQRVTGSCWIGSETDSRADAWRCMFGNEILDPCFSGPLTWVACTVSSQSKVIRLNLMKPLPVRFADPPLNTAKTDPSTIALARNISCAFAGGATSTVAGLRLNYYCSNRAWLVGAPDRSYPLWRILYLPSLKATHATTVPILVARW